MEKEQISSILFFGGTILFKELPPTIVITRNPNWSIETLWYGTGYAKKRRLYYPLSILPEVGCIADFVLNCYEFVFIPFLVVSL
jgi:hypothetical protein